MSLWYESLFNCLWGCETKEERAKCILRFLAMQVPMKWWENALESGSVDHTHASVLRNYSKDLADALENMFVRMLGWAYLSLCVCYWFGLMAALNGERAMGPIWVGIVSNCGAFLFLAYFGLTGTWSSWGLFVQFVGWSSAVATFAIAVGLYMFGVHGDEPVKN